MALLKLDTTAAATSLLFEQLTQLDGREYLLRFVWSTRESTWYLNIYDQDENPIALGVRLVVNWPLLRRFRDPRLPPGLLFLVDMSNTNQEVIDPIDILPTERCPIFYFTVDDGALA